MDPTPVRLGDRARAILRLRHLSHRTEEAYIHWMRRYYEFHGRKDPATLDAEHVTAFLNALANGGHVTASTQNQARAALLFLYREVLRQDLPWLDGLVRAKGSMRLPVVLTREEVRAILSRIHGVPRLMTTLLYGSGLRLLECCRLRVKDVDLARNQIMVRCGKGDKDRATMLPAAMNVDLATHLERVRQQHQADIAGGAGWVELPGALTGSSHPPAECGPGCSPPPGSTSMARRGKDVGTICTRPWSNRPSAERFRLPAFPSGPPATAFAIMPTAGLCRHDWLACWVVADLWRSWCAESA